MLISKTENMVNMVNSTPASHQHVIFVDVSMTFSIKAQPHRVASMAVDSLF